MSAVDTPAVREVADAAEVYRTVPKHADAPYVRGIAPGDGEDHTAAAATRAQPRAAGHADPAPKEDKKSSWGCVVQ
jgi:hypothetical protein